jgi:hypothetical protein
MMSGCCCKIRTSFRGIQQSEMEGRSAEKTVHQKGMIGSHLWNCDLPKLSDRTNTGAGCICVGDKVTHEFQIFPEDWRKRLFAGQMQKSMTLR